ncbi:hypothetical protein OGAPHI_002878 [Ogataea philodendri]|uniref:MRH domain-containing protein n=1 Tax=Ogataea philodendri TaxID=1378263 RepID=A0A9P8P9M4_9ASCO|nr:uncharacterized protein OGAPHI_002878 [Ogataea philodendri]KAH3667229.1 hypothetical protein OGAPHI_002878 [Ogataea philodendri]
MISLRKPTIFLFFACTVLVFFGILSSRNEKLTTEIREEANHLLQQWETLESLPGHLNNQNDTEGIQLEPCTVINPLTNQFFDLRSLGALGNEGLFQAWNARGYDYGKNFSLGICSTPLKQPQNLPQSDFVGIGNRSEVGGYYTDDSGNKRSIGQVSTSPKFRGRKLVLEYTDGSFCEGLEDEKSLRKSTILSFACDREIMSRASVSYVGSINDCSYFFEVRTIHACATAAKKDDMAIIWIFLFICLCALAVFFGGGAVYSLFRNHQSRLASTQRRRHSFSNGVKSFVQTGFEYNQYNDNVPESGAYFDADNRDSNELLELLDSQADKNIND